MILPPTVRRRLDRVLADTAKKVPERQAQPEGKGLEDPDAPHPAANLRNYIAGFSPNMREVLEKFDFDNPTMGTIFEELIRKFNEALNENPGEHFTPRDVVHLMVDLMLAGDAGRIRRKGIVCTVYDPCCGPRSTSMPRSIF